MQSVQQAKKTEEGRERESERERESQRERESVCVLVYVSCPCEHWFIAV